MANQPKAPREVSTMQLTGFCRLSGEAPRVTNDSYSKLTRMEKEGRLRTSGNPKIVEFNHLVEQAKNGYPPLEA